MKCKFISGFGELAFYMDIDETKALVIIGAVVSFAKRFDFVSGSKYQKELDALLSVCYGCHVYPCVDDTLQSIFLYRIPKELKSKFATARHNKKIELLSNLQVVPVFIPFTNGFIRLLEGEAKCGFEQATDQYANVAIERINLVAEKFAISKEDAMLASCAVASLMDNPNCPSIPIYTPDGKKVAYEEFEEMAKDRVGFNNAAKFIISEWWN